MRLLFVSFVGNSQSSGMGRWTHRVAEELRRGRHTVELWFEEDFPVLAGAGRIGRQLFPVALAKRLIAARKSFDVVVVHEPSGLGYGLFRSIFRILPPMVVMSHGIESRAFVEMEEAASRGLARTNRAAKLRHFMFRAWQSDASIRTADHVICLSTLDQEYLVKRLGLKQEKITVAVNGTDEFPNNFKAESGLVISVASWIAEKGCYALPEIWRRVKQRAPTARLLVLGTGSDAATVKAAFASDVRPSVEVISRFSGPRGLMEYARGATAFLLPSMREGSPLALLEAMAMGLPPVVSRVGGVPEILLGELSSLMFDRFDLRGAASIVSELLIDPKRAAHYGLKARERATELTWAKAASIVESACLQVVPQSSRHS